MFNRYLKAITVVPILKNDWITYIPTCSAINTILYFLPCIYYSIKKWKNISITSANYIALKD